MVQSREDKMSQNSPVMEKWENRSVRVTTYSKPGADKAKLGNTGLSES
jgi:hypothetical protein